MRNLFFLYLVIFSTSLRAQNNEGNSGTKIINNLSWSEVKAKAKAEHKHILIDCNSSWCGPCKYLEKVLFPTDTIGNLLNPKFIVVSVQFDSTKDDNSYTKSWYKTAAEMLKQFHITSFPTEVVLDEDASPIAKFTGVSIENGIDNFYENIDKCFNPRYQYFSLKSKEKSQKMAAPSFRREIAEASEFAGELDDAQYYTNSYLKSLDKEQFNTKENYEFIVKNIRTSKDSLFNFIFENYAKIDSIVGTPIAKDKISGTIYYEDLKWKHIYTSPGDYSPIHGMYISEPYWKNLYPFINKKYEKITPNIIYIAKLDYYDLGKFNEKYFELILSKYNPEKPIYQAFTLYQVFNILNNILTREEDNRFWLTLGKQWLDSLTQPDIQNRTLRYKATFQTLLDKCPN